ncbi:hypothetical protein Tco_0797416 [Tanacetum coccineum]
MVATTCHTDGRLLSRKLRLHLHMGHWLHHTLREMLDPVVGLVSIGDYVPIVLKAEGGGIGSVSRHLLLSLERFRIELKGLLDQSLSQALIPLSFTEQRYSQNKRHSICMTWFEQLETHLYDLYLLNSPYVVDAFKPAFRSFFGEEHQTFKLKMFHNLDQLRLQLERENLHGVNAKTCLQALRTQFKEFLASKGVNATDLLNQGWQQDFEYFTRCESSAYRQSENHNAFSKSEIETQMQRQEEKVNMREAVDAGLVVTESSGTKPDKQDTSSSSGNYTTQAVDADIGPVNDEEPFAEVQLTALHNILANEQQHTEQSEPFTKASILGKPPLQPSRNHLVVRQPNAFTSERPRISRPRFASQVDEKKDLSKTVTPHYLPKVRESAAAKPHQVNAPNYSRNSHKESYGSNDMVHAYFLEDARKMTQDKTRIPNHRDMASTRAHCTPNACTPKLRNIYRSSPVSKCSGGMSNGTSKLKCRSSRNSNLMNMLQMMSVHISSGLVLHLDDVQCECVGLLNLIAVHILDGNVNLTAGGCYQIISSPRPRIRSAEEKYSLPPVEPTRLEEQILPLLRTVTDWKGKPSIDLQSCRSNPIFHIFSFISKNTNFVSRAFIVHQQIPFSTFSYSWNYSELMSATTGLTEAEEEAVAREVHATHARIVSESEPEPTQRRQSGIAFRDSFIVSKKRDAFILEARMKELVTYLGSSDESKSSSEAQVRKLGSSQGHQTVTSTPPVIAPFTEFNLIKPSSLVTPPPINTEATTITPSLPEITPFIALQLRVARLEQEMSEVKKTDHSADVLASIESQVPTAVVKYLGTKLDDALLKVLERHTADLIEKYSVLPGPESIQIKI